jgi:thiol:disulfide interchange protein
MSDHFHRANEVVPTPGASAPVAATNRWRRSVPLILLAAIAVVSFRFMPTWTANPVRPLGAGSGDAISWRTDLASALADSRTLHKPVLVDFSASWCPPCQTMKREAWPDTQVAQLVEREFVPVLLDVDQTQGQEAGRRYGVEFIPSILVLDSEGRVLRQGGFMSRDELVEFLRAGGKSG